MPKYVTGVGNRDVSPDGAKRITEAAKLLEQAGYILRSGGADGCDTLFEQNMTRKEIYLPWRGFNHNTSNFCQVSKDAFQIASTVHPRFKYLSPAAQKLHARNAYQVLGWNLDSPSDILVCWTRDGCTGEASSSSGTGGTRTAIVLADRHGIPIFNVKNDDDFSRLKMVLEREIRAESSSI